MNMPQLRIYFCVLLSWINIQAVLCLDVPSSFKFHDSNNRHYSYNRLKRASSYPVFSETMYYASVPENQPPGLSVIRVSASDPDNGIDITYSLEGNGAFAIDAVTGIVRTAYSLDRESLDTYSYKVKAVKGSHDSSTGTATLSITVLDENDNIPVFTQAVYNVTVSESVPVMTTVMQVTADDLDVGLNGVIRYSIDHPSNSTMFAIDSFTGTVKTMKPLDAEVRSTYRLVVRAENQTPLRLSSTAVVNIFIADENDNAPLFSRSTYFSTISENIPIMSSVIQVSATDRDKGVSGTIRYSLSQLSNYTSFNIDPLTGIIRTIKSIDREKESLYRFAVIARDQGLSVRFTTTATVVITVDDENDNFPRFTQEFYTVNILENKDVRNKPVIYQIVATDLDTGPNALITYSIKGGNTEGVFGINTTTGDIYIQKPLVYEQRRDFRLNIGATDHGIPPLTTNTTVHIKVVDVNLHAPLFSKQFYQASVLESAPVGSLILTVSASDMDSGGSQHLVYSMAYSPAALNIPFIVEPSGRILLRSFLDRETQSMYQFTVQVSDRGIPPLSSIATVGIRVEDVNDNRPIFSQKMYNASLTVSSPLHQPVLQVKATDADVGDNALLSYTIISGNINNTFVINQLTGMIILARKLSFNGPNHYILTVRVADAVFFDDAEVEIILRKGTDEIIG